MTKRYKKKVIKAYSDKEVIALYENIGFWEVEKTIVDRFIQKDASWKILDAGCGAGRTSIEFNNMGNVVYGIDISYDILKAADKNKNNLSKIYFVNSDLPNIPIKSSCLDCIVCLHSVLGLVIDKLERKAFIGECHRILNREGLLIFNVHNLLYPGFLGKRWIRLIIDGLGNLYSHGRLEFGTREVNETGQTLLCHYFILPEIKKLIQPQFRILEIFQAKGFWHNNRHSSSTLFCEDFYIVCRKI
jgi:ubiquinone/menaquinone biosynthesis C-methylase UbiE